MRSRRIPRRLILLLAAGLLLVGAALFLRVSPWARERQLRHLSSRSLALLALERPNDASVFRELGTRLGAEGDAAGSAQAFSRAIQLEPRDYDSQLSLGMALIASGRPYDAERCFIEAAKLRPKESDPHFLLANLYDTYRNKSSTVAPLEKVTQLDPKNAEAWYRLGVALEDLHQYDQALPALEKAASLAPERLGYLRDLAQIQMHFGKQAEARASLERASKLSQPDPGVLVLLAKLDLDQGLPAERLGPAQASLNKALEIDPQFAPAFRELGKLHTRRREHPRAVEALRMAVRYDPSDGQALFELGRALLRVGKQAEGEKYIKGFQQLSEARRSVKVLEDRIHQDPKNAELRLRIARLYRKYEDDSRALNQYQVYLSMKKDPQVSRELESYRVSLAGAQQAQKP